MKKIVALVSLSSNLIFVCHAILEWGKNDAFSGVGGMNFFIEFLQFKQFFSFFIFYSNCTTKIVY